MRIQAKIISQITRILMKEARRKIDQSKGRVLKELKSLDLSGKNSHREREKP